MTEWREIVVWSKTYETHASGSLPHDGPMSSGDHPFCRSTYLIGPSSMPTVGRPLCRLGGELDAGEQGGQTPAARGGHVRRGHNC
jgi:hypothetical protein